MDVRSAMFELYEIMHDDHTPHREVLATCWVITAIAVFIGYHFLQSYFPYTKIPWPTLKNGTVELFGVVTCPEISNNSIPGGFTNESVNIVEEADAKKPRGADRVAPKLSSKNSSPDNRVDTDERRNVASNPKQEVTKLQKQKSDILAKALEDRVQIKDEEESSLELRAVEDELKKAKAEFLEQQTLATNKAAKDSVIIIQLRQELGANQKVMAERQEEMYRLQDELQQAKDTQDLNARASVKSEEPQEQQQEYKYSEAQFQEALVQKCAAKQENTLNEEVQALKSQLKSERLQHANNVQTLNNDLENKKEETETLQHTFHTQLEEQRNADRQVLEAKAAEYQAELDQLRTQLKTAVEQTQRSDPGLQAASEAKDRFIAEQGLQLSQHDEHIKRTDDTIRNLQEENKMLHAVKMENNKEADELRKRLDVTTQNMQLQINDLRNGGLQMQTRFRQVELERDHYANELQRAKDEHARSRQQTEADPQIKKAYEQEIGHLKSHLQQLTNERDHLRNLHGAPNDNLTKHVVHLEKEVNKERLQRARAETRFNEVSDKLAVATRAANNLEKSKAAESSSNASHLAHIRRGMVSPQEVLKKISEAEAKLTRTYRQEAESHLREVNLQMSQLEASCTSQRSAIETLKNQLSAMTDQKEMVECALNERERDMKVKAQSLEVLEQHIQQRDNYMKAIQDGYEAKEQQLNKKIEQLQARVGTSDVSQTPTQEVAEPTQSRPKRNIDDFNVDDPAPPTPSARRKAKPTAASRRAARDLASTKAAGSPQQDSTKHKRPSNQEDDYDDLFDGPEPDLALMIAQDEENARRELEEEQARAHDADQAELVRELNREMGFDDEVAEETTEMYDA